MSGKRRQGARNGKLISTKNHCPFSLQMFTLRNSKSESDFLLNPEKWSFPKPTRALIKVPGKIIVSGGHHGGSQSLALCRECPYLIPRWLGLLQGFYRPHPSKAVKTTEANLERAKQHFTRSILSPQTGTLLCPNVRVQFSNLL